MPSPNAPAACRIHDLSNGWRLATTHLPHAGSVAIGVYLRVGSRHEGENESGAAHFIEHMLFKGTQSRTARDIVVDVESVGGSINAYTTEDHTCYDASGPADLLPVLSHVLLDMVWNSTLPEDEVMRERSVIEEEIVMYRENPGDHVDDLATAALWSPHPLGRPILGSAESLLQLDRRALDDFYRRHYHGGSHVISIAGPQGHDEALHIVEQQLEMLGRTPGPAAPQAPTFDRNLAERTVVHETRPIDQTHLALSFHIPGIASAQRPHYSLLSTLLGGTMSSRLFQELREKEALCYQIDCDLSLLGDTGSLDISLGSDAALADRAVATIQREITDLTENGPTPEELDHARKFLIGQSKIGFETTGSWMSWCGDSLLSFEHIRDPEALRAQLGEVTTDHIRTAMQDCSQPCYYAAGSIGPDATSPAEQLCSDQ